MEKNLRFQRKNASSNASVGREFEVWAEQYFAQAEGLDLTRNFKLSIGAGEVKKEHNFDLGCDYDTKKILVECKSHTWTDSGKVPSAKLTVWIEAMFYFLLAPSEYRKIMFVQKDFNSKLKKTLAQYYLQRYSHLIPEDVELWEYDVVSHKPTRLR